jgi:Domain of unknown function (DUF6398)/Plasmid pRiA4b ORF-3-like protein
MTKTKKSEDIPKTMQEKFDSITALTNNFSKLHLNDEYAQMIRFATAALCRKRPSPLASGQDKTWACGITHAIGMVNFLFDSSQVPHISSKELYKCFGVGASTGQAKSKLVRDTLGMHQLDPDWCLPSQLDRNPMAWFITVNGFILDARSAPREVQEIAYAKGLIPYIPGEDPSNDISNSGNAQSTAPPNDSSKDVSKKTASSPPKVLENSSDALYVLEVFLLDGPISEKFIAKNPVVARTIEIRGSNTLEDLHKTLFKAFNRKEEHMYEFQVGGDRPNDPKATCYRLQQSFLDPSPSESSVHDVSQSAIASLGLSIDDAFGYWFDFGDDWWHQINVVDIKDGPSSGKYPKITERTGASPPQYAMD